jgi:uncharacterized DUF497 family protein
LEGALAYAVCLVSISAVDQISGIYKIPFRIYNNAVMRFEWDSRKAARNLREHGVSFESAKRVFDDPHHLIAEDITDDHEQRYQAIGLSESAVLLVVAFVDRSASDNEIIIRIISARKAISYEEIYYNSSKA